MATRTQNTGMKPIDILKKGLAKLRNRISDRKSKLEADLKANKHISEVEKDGLDADNNDSEKDVTPTKPGPARHEALQAVLTLQEYIGTIDDPFVHKLEVMLNSLMDDTSGGGTKHERH